MNCPVDLGQALSHSLSPVSIPSGLADNSSRKINKSKLHGAYMTFKLFDDISKEFNTNICSLWQVKEGKSRGVSNKLVTRRP